MKKIQTTWDLGLLYKSEMDPQIEADLKLSEAAYDTFAKKYAQNPLYIESEAGLAGALGEYEKLHTLPIFKPLAYFRYRQDTNANDAVAEAKVNVFSERSRKSANKLVFFQVALSKIAKDKQKAYLKSSVLAPYRYFLKCIFDQSQYVLSEPEEKVLNLMRLPAYSLWVQGNEKLTSNQKIVWKKKTFSLAQAFSSLHNLPVKERHQLAAILNKTLKDISHFAESEINALVIAKKIEDELRGYQKPYSETVLGYQNELATVENLVATVTKYFPMAHRFYKLKAKMLGMKKLVYSDRNAHVGKATKKITFEKGVEVVRQSFVKFGPEYADIFDDFLAKGQIDVFPKVGKRGGAYCSSSQAAPTFVLLNHVPDFHSVNTMAHEMGHAYHAKYSLDNQPPLYVDHTIATAEVASTFFENFVFDEVFSLLSEKEKIVALHDKIAGSVNTIFRQIACFNFELELHNTIRAKGSLPKEEIAKLMTKHLGAYLGPVFTVTNDDGFFFVDWMHIRRFFYVYSYAFGELVSSALYQMYKDDNSFKEKVKQFLSAGGSESPENIFKSIGVDVTKPEFFEAGLKKIEQDIIKLEGLLKA